MTLASMQADDAATVLAEIGESISYIPDGGSARSISAVIERSPLIMRAEPRGPNRPITIYVANDNTTGIAATEVTARDTVTLPRDWGGSNVTLRIKLIGQTYGWTVLECIG